MFVYQQKRKCNKMLFAIASTKLFRYLANITKDSVLEIIKL